MAFFVAVAFLVTMGECRGGGHSAATGVLTLQSLVLAPRQRINDVADVEHLDAVGFGGLKRGEQALLEQQTIGDDQFGVTEFGGLLGRGFKVVGVGVGGDDDLNGGEVAHHVAGDVSENAGGGHDPRGGGVPGGGCGGLTGVGSSATRSGGECTSSDEGGDQTEVATHGGSPWVRVEIGRSRSNEDLDRNDYHFQSTVGGHPSNRNRLPTWRP